MTAQRDSTALLPGPIHLETCLCSGCYTGVPVQAISRPLSIHGQCSQPCCWCPHGVIRPGRRSQLPKTGAQLPPSHGFCHGVLWLMQYQLLLTARDLLPSAVITCLGHLWATHPQLPREAGGAFPPGSPMGLVNSTPFTTPRIMFTSLLSAAVLLTYVFTVPKPKIVKFLGITIASDKDGFCDTMIHGL